MKKIYLLLTIICFSLSVTAQRNNLKISGFVWADWLEYDWSSFYIYGFAYERQISHHFSAQMSLFRTKSNWADEFYPTKSLRIGPELRYYFGSKNPTSKSFFLSLFTDWQWTSEDNYDYSFICDFGPCPDYELGYKERSINQGFLFGKNFSLGRRWRFELFGGPVVRDINGKQFFYLSGARPYRDAKLLLRTGFYLSYGF